RKIADGKWQVIQMTLLPGQADIERELVKTAEGDRIEKLRREAVSAEGDGIVLLNAAKQVGDQYEIGPLLQNENGEVLGFGIRAGAKAVEEMLEKVNQLP